MSWPFKIFNDIKISNMLKTDPSYRIYNDAESGEEPVFESWILSDDECGKAELHRMLRADAPGCFHGHPYESRRIILRGGYVEEVADVRGDSEIVGTKMRTCAPGFIGDVGKSMYHRIDHLIDGPSISLWLTMPGRSPFQLVGSGWGHKEGQWIK